MTGFKPGWLQEQVTKSVEALKALPPPLRPKTFMDNPPACGAPKNWRWGYLDCGCRNDGYGRHLD